MIRKSSRIVLTLCLLFVFAFLCVNVLLNFTPLRENITSTLEDDTNIHVKVGYLFLNWKLQPVLQKMTIESTDSSRMQKKADTTRLDQVILDFDWRTFWKNPTAPLEKYVDRVHVGTLSYSNYLGEGSGRSGPGVIPVPVKIERWEVLFYQNQQEIFQVAGRDLRSEGPHEPLRSHLREYQHQPAEGTLQLTLDQGRLSARVDVQSISFSNHIWELDDDRWSGVIQFDQMDEHSLLKLDLRGTPGRIGGDLLPEVSLASEIQLSDRQYQVRSLEIDSPFFQSRSTGIIDPVRDEISLKGNFDVPLPEMVDSVLSNRFGWIKKVSSSDLEGTYEIGGSLEDPDLSGEMNLPASQFTLDTSGGTSVAEMRNVIGRISDDRLELVSGELREETKLFRLDSGFLEIKEGEVTFSLTGPLTMQPIRSPQNAFYPAWGESIRNIEDLEVMFSMTSTLGPESQEMALAVEEGSFRYGPGQFQNFRGILSYSSHASDKNILEASLQDPDGNEWRLSGPIGGPYQVQGVPRSLSRWLDYLVPDLPVEGSVSLRNTPVRATLQSADQMSDNQFKLRTEEDARITINDRTLKMNGMIQGDSNRIHFRSLEVGDDRGQLTVDGSLTPDIPFGHSSLDLSFTSQSFPVKSWISEIYKPVSSARLTGELDIKGSIRSPNASGTIQFDELDYGSLNFRDLRADLEQQSDTMVFKEIAGSLNNGQVRGQVRLGDSNLLDLEVDVVAIDLPTLFPEGSWANRHVGGSMTISTTLRGRLGEPDSFEGQFSGTLRGLMLDQFPRIEGIEKVARPEVLKNPILIEPTDFSFPVRDGTIHVSNVDLVASGLRLKTNGEVDFEGIVQLSTKLILLDEAMKGFIQDVLGDFYRRLGIGGDKRKLTIPLQVKGPMHSLNVTVKHSEVNTNFRKNLVESLLSRPVGKPINEVLDEVLRTD